MNRAAGSAVALRYQKGKTLQTWPAVAAGGIAPEHAARRRRRHIRLGRIGPANWTCAAISATHDLHSHR